MSFSYLCINPIYFIIKCRHMKITDIVPYETLSISSLCKFIIARCMGNVKAQIVLKNTAELSLYRTDFLVHNRNRKPQPECFADPRMLRKLNLEAVSKWEKN